MFMGAKFRDFQILTFLCLLQLEEIRLVNSKLCCEILAYSISTLSLAHGSFLVLNLKPGSVGHA